MLKLKLSLLGNILPSRVKSHNDCGKKELHRSKTLPIIRTPKVSSAEAISPPGTQKQMTRKQSVPIHNILKRGKQLQDGYEGAGRLEPFQPIKSCIRRRSTGFINKLALPSNRGSAWNFEDDTDSTTSSENMTTGSDDVSVQKTPTPLYYTTPPKANITRNADDRKSSKRPSSHHSDPSHLNLRGRSVSLDCGDGRMMKLFASESDNLQNIPSSREGLRASPSDPGSLLHNGYPSPGRPPRTPLSTPKKRPSISSSETSSSSPGKLERKRLSKEYKTYDIIALFDAVENQDLDAVKDILETNGIDINSVNSEFLTPLDVAVMTNNIPMAKMLLSHGARESPMFQKGEMRSQRLETLVTEAEKRVIDLTQAVINGSSGNTIMSSSQQKENERQLNHWEFRHRLLKRMKAGYDHARCPDPPTNVTLSISGSSSLLVKFSEPLNRNGAVVTKYKVEWSRNDSFSLLDGELLLEDVRSLEVEIKKLKKGMPYYVRVSAMNMKGFSQPATSNPQYAVPSSWRDAEHRLPRCQGKLKILEELFTQVKSLRPADAPTIKDTPGSSSPMRKKKGFKNLFSSAPKFHKAVKSGVYLACYFCYDDKVLVTSEEQVPMVEVDETFAGPSLHLDLYWLMKVACTWEDVRSLRQDMERSTAEGKVHFRGKLLQAVSVLQNALGTHDLGKFYYKPLKDSSGSIVLATVNFLKDPKVVSLTSGKWVPFSRLQRRQSQSIGDFVEDQDTILSSINEMRVYHRTSSMPLRPGLYLGYLKLHVAIDVVRVLVSQAAPNVLPNVKVRDCSNISMDEWQWLKQLHSGRPSAASTSTNQQAFYSSLSQASEKLFKMLSIPEELCAGHRLYDCEVIELNAHVSFLLILPPPEDLCIIPSSGEEDVEKTKERENFTLLPVQVFEMINMCTYQPHFISRYSRLSSILEMDTILAQQTQREAFSKEELHTAKDRVHQMMKLQSDLDKTWKDMRWTMDIITTARSRTFPAGIPVQMLLTPSANEDSLSVQLELKGKILDNNNYQQCNSNSCDSNEISVGKDHRKIAKFYDPLHEDAQENGHLDTQSDASSHNDILRVYAAYETGLAKGTSVKLHVTPKTTAREVINLVVVNLNQAVINKGKPGPIYSEEEFSEFCLVAVIGARERILRDDYQPLQLQNPWTKGKLFVRMRNNLLAAIQQGQATAV
ncbi:ankyrin repeat and fibronectin type-III domain-containing protein 1-like isoform X3 [Dreissena polymorpha]|uniref:ankyrin repeat and fibronectin type-III domain-containing protein 1-like isoform X3 n=1 Tax=Dreissena polymorpha TaxID=45954 RepID=UPI0022653D4A|nr:ankyrin repeat and fibronectin type-III domain-containing protein 1-like isoform X3 [Dreissena polymorpha]